MVRSIEGLTLAERLVKSHSSSALRMLVKALAVTRRILGLSEQLLHTVLHQERNRVVLQGNGCLLSQTDAAV